MLTRIWYMAVAVLGVCVVLGAGWLWSPHDRLGGILVLAIAAVAALLALRPSRASRRRPR